MPCGLRGRYALRIVELRTQRQLFRPRPLPHVLARDRIRAELLPPVGRLGCGHEARGGRPRAALCVDRRCGVGEPFGAGGGVHHVLVRSGPAGEGDRVDLLPAGHEELSGGLSFCSVNDTVEAGDAAEGAGILTAPAEPGTCELRYVLARDADRRVILRVLLAAGGTMPETGPTPVGVGMTSPGWRADPLHWSARPSGPRPDAPQAVAMPEALPLPRQAEHYPGRCQVEGHTDALAPTLVPAAVQRSAVPQSP